MKNIRSITIDLDGTLLNQWGRHRIEFPHSNSRQLEVARSVCLVQPTRYTGAKQRFAKLPLRRRQTMAFMP